MRIVVSGSFQYRGAPGRDLMTPGCLLLGNAGQYFECGHEHGAGDRCISFRFSQEYFERLSADVGGLSANAAFKLLRLPPLRELSSLVARARAGLGGTQHASWEELSVQIVAKTLKLANGHPAGSTDPLPSSLARATRIVRMIERDTDCKLSLGALAQHAGLSPYHFLRSFQQLTGLTPHQYVLRTRLREAAVRLASGKDKVLDVAFDCGFGDVSNFNRAFLELRNVVLVPHIGSATRATRTAMAMLAGKNLSAVLSGRRPPNLLNPEAWPKRRR